MMSESTSMTKIPPIRSRRISVSVTIANPAIAPPSANEPVSPMMTSAGNALYQRNPIVPPIERRRERREIEDRSSLRSPGSPERSHEMPDDGEEGEQSDRRDAGEEAVDPVREVGAVDRAGDHEEEERVVEDAQLEVPADDREVERRVEAGGLPQQECGADGDEREKGHLPAPR